MGYDPFAVFFGLVFGVIAVIVIIVLICAIMSIKKEKDLAYQRKMEAELKREKEKERIKREEERIKREEEQLEHNVRRFENNPRTIKAAEEYATAFINYIVGVNRDKRDKFVNVDSNSLLLHATLYRKSVVSCSISVSDSKDCNKVAPRIHRYNGGCEFSYDSSTYLVDFSAENIQTLKPNELKAFAIAIANKSLEFIKEKYAKDESGTDYSLKIKINDNYGYSNIKTTQIDFIYQAPNGFYEAPKAW